MNLRNRISRHSYSVAFYLVSRSGPWPLPWLLQSNFYYLHQQYPSLLVRIQCLPRIVFGHVFWPAAILASHLVFWRTTYYCNYPSLYTIVSKSSSASTCSSSTPPVLTFISAWLSAIASTSDSASGNCLQDYKFSIVPAFLSQSVSTSVFASLSPSVSITIWT